MALVRKPAPQPSAESLATPAVDISHALPGAPRRRGTGGMYPRLMAAQVSDAMYQAIKEEVARRSAAGEPSDVASMGAIVREAVAKHLSIPL